MMGEQQLDKAIRAGLDFFVNTQCMDELSADYGRFPWYFDSVSCETNGMSHNWTTATVVKALLAGGKAYNEQKYYDAARRGIGYIKTLQLDTACFREITPQSVMAHPRDALTAALGCLDFSQHFDCADSFDRARRFADWFIQDAMADGYPHWTVRFDGEENEAAGWCGSFHSGSAFFMYRMYLATSEEKYRTAMEEILDFYNEVHLSEDGSIKVVVDRASKECINDQMDPEKVQPGWITMHCYNDDFGALANLAAWKLTGEDKFREAAVKFLENMFESQKPCGGFGPADRDEIVPNAAGVIIIELLAAQQLGLYADEKSEVLERAVQYLLSIQVRDTGTLADGGFLGVNDRYACDGRFINTRTASYSVLALLQASGVQGCPYSIV